MSVASAWSREDARVRTDGVEEALRELAAGRPVIVLDASDRENEGDLVMAATAATPEWMAFFVRHGTGLVCVPMDDRRADRLGLALMVARNEESMGTAFTITVDARTGVSTGISAADRARTVTLLADPATRPDDLVRPGHVLPLRAKPGGVLTRPGHTEAAVDLVRLAGLEPVGVIVELVEDDGTMRRAESCRRFADEHGLTLVTIEDLVAHLAALDAPAPVPPGPACRVERVASTQLPTAAGHFIAHGYRDWLGIEHVALVLGEVGPDGGRDPVPVRVHSECLTGDVFGSLRCDCGPQLHQSVTHLQQAGRGVVIYLRGHEGRGIGLTAKLAAYALQDAGRDTVDANVDLGFPVDSRDYAVAAAVLADLGVTSVRLLTNNPAKVDALARYGVPVHERVGVLIPPTEQNLAYLRTKQHRLGHHLPHLLAEADGR